MTLERLPEKRFSGLRLGGFIALSAAVHWWLLTGATAQFPAAPPAAGSVAVTLLNTGEATETLHTPVTPSVTPSLTKATPAPVDRPEPPAHAAAPARPPATPDRVAQPQPATPDAAPRPAAPAVEPAAIQTAEAKDPQPGAAAPDKAALSLARARDEIRLELHNALGRHFRYPFMAQRRGWEGTVLLELLIETDGRISRVSLAQSSGYGLLDNSAMETLKRVGNVREAARWLEGQRLEMQLPVSYRLSNS